MYPEQLVAPMRTDLTSAGFKELKTPEQVESELTDHKRYDTPCDQLSLRMCCRRCASWHQVGFAELG